MKKLIALLEEHKLNYNDFSAFGPKVAVVYNNGCASLRIEEHGENVYSFYEYSSEYTYTEQSYDDLKLHLSGSSNIPMNKVNPKTIPNGSFLQ